MLVWNLDRTGLEMRPLALLWTGRVSRWCFPVPRSEEGLCKGMCSNDQHSDRGSCSGEDQQHSAPQSHQVHSGSVEDISRVIWYWYH